jgi:3-oxoacyl-[acyl-carrier protein] reductase
VLCIPGDLTEAQTVSKLFGAAIERFGGIDVVVANAGRSGATKPVADITDAEYDGLQAVNNRAVFLVLWEASRRIRDGGRIINISSSTTACPQAGYAMYAASKVSSSMITRILAAELGLRNITSNSLIVGPIASGFLSGDGAFDPQVASSTSSPRPRQPAAWEPPTTSEPSRRSSHDPRRAGSTASC